MKKLELLVRRHTSWIRNLMKNALNKPFLSAAVVLLLAMFFTACQSPPTQTGGNLKRLQGYWEGDGSGGKYSITISDDSLFYYGRADFWFETTFTLPAGTDPQQLHATIVKDNSADQSDIGTVIVAIYKIENGTLTLAVNQDSDGSALNSFSSEANGSIARYDLKQVQPPKSK